METPETEDPLQRQNLRHLRPKTPRSESEELGESSFQSAGSGKAATTAVKVYRCKKCPDFVAVDKNDFSDHQRELHIDPSKLLKCPLTEDGCRFVTQYRHHLDYHVRNHAGSKPFRCLQYPACDYTCVSRSMLNSHMKSHSSYVQFRCSCGFATKYRHTLKAHCNKAGPGHGPDQANSVGVSMAASHPGVAPVGELGAAVVSRKLPRLAIKITKEESDGSVENNEPVAVQWKSLPSEETTEAPVKQRRISKKQRLQLALLLNGGEQQDEPVPGKKRRMSKKRKLQEARLLESPPVERDANEPEDLRFPQNMSSFDSGLPAELPVGKMKRPYRKKQNNLAVFLATHQNDFIFPASGCPLGSDAISPSSHNSDTAGICDWTPPEASRNRRKGPAFKVDQALLHRLQEMNSMDDVETIEIVQPQSPLEAGFTYQSNVEGNRKRLLNPPSMNGRTSSLQYSCGACGISFGDVEMFELHASFHKPSAPFTCTSCGYAATDRVDFYRHIAQVAHV